MTTETSTGTSGQTAAAALSGQGGNGNGAAPPQVPEWAKDFPDDLKSEVTNYHWKDPAGPVKSYVELKKKVGPDKVDRLVLLPKDEADAEGWGQVYNRLGRPAKPEEYGLDKVEGADPEFAKHMAPLLHEAGVSKRQAERLLTGYQAYGQALEQKVAAEFSAATERDWQELQREWGNKADERTEIARRAVRRFFGPSKQGKDGKPDPADPVQQQLATLEKVMGTKAMMAKFYELGLALGEDKLPPASSTGGGRAGSPEGAKAELEAAMKDPETMKAWTNTDHPQHKETTARLHELHEAAYGGGRRKQS
jgi:hypothetical protein